MMGPNNPLLRSLRIGVSSLQSKFQQCSRPAAFRKLHTTRLRNTDGVYNELTNMRLKTPWIDAFKKRQREEDDDAKMRSITPATHPQPSLKPKKMSESFHRVVCMLFEPTAHTLVG